MLHNFTNKINIKSKYKEKSNNFFSVYRNILEKQQ